MEEAHENVWYLRKIRIPKLKPGKGVCLNFQGVDYCAKAWVNGCLRDTEGSHFYGPKFNKILIALDKRMCNIYNDNVGHQEGFVDE